MRCVYLHQSATVRLVTTNVRRIRSPYPADACRTLPENRPEPLPLRGSSAHSTLSLQMFCSLKTIGWLSHP